MVEQQSTPTTAKTFDGNEPIYRAYLLDGSDNIIWAELIPAYDHKGAMSVIRGMMGSHAVELWDRAQLIIRLEASEELCAA